MMWYGHDFSWWWFVPMMLAMVGFWALVAWVVVTLVRGDRSAATPTPEAEQILAERYARGELETAEYHERLDDLRRTRSLSRT